MQERIKQQILDEVLKHVPFEGWSSSLLTIASKNLGFDEHFGEVLFSNKVLGLIDLFFERIDLEMLELGKASNLENMKIRERIIEAIKIRLKILSKHRPVIIRTISYLSWPLNIPFAMKLTWRTIDLIWYEFGKDASTDFNYYTKRGLLASVYSATIFYWINDESESYVDTIDFLTRKINDVVEIGKFLSGKK